MTARKEFTKAKVKSMVSTYKKGATLRSIAEEAGCSVTTLRELLVANGAEMRPRGKVAKPKEKAKATKKAPAKVTTTPKAPAKKGKVVGKAVPAKGAKAKPAGKTVAKKGVAPKGKVKK